MMRAEDSLFGSSFRSEELRQDCQTLLAGDELGRRFHARLKHEEFELVFREFRIPLGMSE